MPNYKGAPIVVLRGKIRERGHEVEEALRQQLPVETRRIYDTLVATAWIPIGDAQRILDEAALILTPDQPDPHFALGKVMAHEMLTGVYRFIVRVVTVPFLVEQSATLWGKYHDTGTASSDRPHSHSARMIVRGYPSLPEGMRKITAGWIASSVEQTGEKNVHVRTNNSPAAWDWLVSWR
jgi:hypothetical protein